MTIADATRCQSECERLNAAGVCSLRTWPGQKRPTVPWREFRERLPTADEIASWSGRDGGVCVICGAVSGGVEMIDFDLGGALFDAWCEIVGAGCPGLVDRLVVESTPSGGRHVVYRCDDIAGNTKLAIRVFEADGPGQIVVAGKEYEARQGTDGRWSVEVAAIETRGEGGLFVCAPTPGYTLLRGDLADPPRVTPAERAVMLDAARSLGDARPTPVAAPPSDPTDEPAFRPPAEPERATKPVNAAGGRPGDAFNAAGDPRPYLERAGWRRIRQGDNEHWCRPGKADGTSATLKGGVFYVFSSNAAPFEPGRAYSPFAVYATLDHRGDYAAAARSLAAAGWGEPKPKATGVDLSGLLSPPASVAPATQQPDDSDWLPVLDLCDRFSVMHEPVVEGSLRRGEVMNVIAAPKTHKSWMVMGLAFCVATGRRWLGEFPCRRGRVLIVDNELHPATLAKRVADVLKGMGVLRAEIGPQVDFLCLRGRGVGLDRLYEMLIAKGVAGDYDMIVLDAWYRFIPAGSDENSNSDIANLYNLVDRIAESAKAAIVIVHHTSKGSQSGKGSPTSARGRGRSRGPRTRTSCSGRTRSPGALCSTRRRGRGRLRRRSACSGASRSGNATTRSTRTTSRA